MTLVSDIVDMIFKRIGEKTPPHADTCGYCCNFGEAGCEHENAGPWADMKECPQERLFCDTLADQITREAGLRLRAVKNPYYYWNATLGIEKREGENNRYGGWGRGRQAAVDLIEEGLEVESDPTA